MNNFELTDEQKQVANRAIDNALVKKKQSFVTGPAGCGKTTIATEISNILFENGMKVYFAAPTHTASNRLQKVLSDDSENQIDVSTVHKFLGMRPISNDYGKMTFAMTDERKLLEDDSILIVDESSMLSEELYGNIKTICKHRVIFLGDSCQIPPVTENDGNRSRLLTVNDSSPPVQRYVSEVFELKQVHRQNNTTALYHLCKFLRDAILDGSSAELYDNKHIIIDKMRELANWDDDTLFLDIPGRDVVPSILGINDTCFLGFGNPTVSAVQDHLPEWYINGGYGITNAPVFKLTKNDSKAKYVMVFPNNEHVQIISINSCAEKKWGVIFDDVEISNGFISERVYVPNNQEAFQDDYLNWINVAKYNAGLSVNLTPRQKTEYKFNDYISLNNNTMNDFVASVTTLREGRASTIHRAQGQQWNNCIIAFNNIMFAGVNIDKELADRDVHRKIISIKLLYTAISRTKEKVVFCFENKKENYEPRR